MPPTSIVLRPEVFSEDYIPQVLHAREEHLEQLMSCLAPALKRRKPLHALLIGPSGTGKSLVARTALAKLRAQSVASVYINCCEASSLYAILDAIIHELVILRAEKIDTTFKLKAINDRLRGKPLVVVLDEIDRLSPKERSAAIYNLTTMGSTGLSVFP